MLYSVDEANRLITAGKRLHIAGDAAALARLTRGDWIGGTIRIFSPPRAVRPIANACSLPSCRLRWARSRSTS